MENNMSMSMGYMYPMDMSIGYMYPMDMQMLFFILDFPPVGFVLKPVWSIDIVLEEFM